MLNKYNRKVLPSDGYNNPSKDNTNIHPKNLSKSECFLNPLRPFHCTYEGIFRAINKTSLREPRLFPKNVKVFPKLISI